MSFHAPNISKSLLEAIAAVMAEGAAKTYTLKVPKRLVPAVEKALDDKGLGYTSKKAVSTVVVYTFADPTAYDYAMNVVGDHVNEDEQLDQLNEGPDTKVDGLDGLIKQSIEQFKKHYGKEWSKVMHASIDRLAEGAFSDIDIDQKETKADPKRKAEYTKEFNELLTKHKNAGLDPSQRKRLARLSIILGKKLPGA